MSPWVSFFEKGRKKLEFRHHHRFDHFDYYHWFEVFITESFVPDGVGHLPLDVLLFRLLRCVGILRPQFSHGAKGPSPGQAGRIEN